MVIAVLLLALLVVTPGKGASSDDALKALGVAYSAGTYSMTSAACTGFITSSSEMICLYIDMPKVFLKNQKVNVTSVTGASLRVGGKYATGYEVDLTGNIGFARPGNDGAALYIRLDNAEKWKGQDGKTLQNNLPVSGVVNITFNVKE